MVNVVATDRMFYEDALAASRALELTLTSRSKDAGAVPMAGARDQRRRLRVGVASPRIANGLRSSRRSAPS